MARLNYPLIIRRDAKYKAIADLGLRLYDIDKTLIMSNLVDIVPVKLLPLLAEKWSVLGNDGWSLAESEDAKRRLIKSSVELHRHKGTVWSIREVIRQLGFGEVEIIEGLFDKRHDGQITRNGVFYHGDRSKWAHYQVILKKIITTDQAIMLREILSEFAPARCVLAHLDYREVNLRHNGTASRNGLYNRGTA